MLRTTLLKTLREYRIAILAWSLGLSILMLSNVSAYGQLGSSPASKATLVNFAQTFRFLGDPVAVASVTGYSTWRILGFMPVALSIWTLLAGARLLRREEDQGSIDIMLAAPISRWSYSLQKVGAFALALLAICLLLSLACLSSLATLAPELGLSDYLLVGLNVGLTSFLFGMLGLLLSQFFRTAGAAAGMAGGLLALCYALEGGGLTSPALDGLRRVSPFFYYGLSKPLVLSYGTNAGALLITAGVATLLLIASLVLFTQRDIGSVAVTFPSFGRGATPPAATRLAAAAANPLSRTYGLQQLRAQLPMILWWTAGISGYAFYGTALVRAIREQLQALLVNSPSIATLLHGTNLSTDMGLLSVMISTFVPLLVAAFALVQTTVWSNNLDNGRTELLLSAPQPRWRIILESYAVFIFSSIVIIGTLAGTIIVAATSNGLHVDTQRIIGAVVALLPMQLFVAGLVYLLATRFRSVIITGIVGAYLAVAYFAELLQSFLKLPDWIISMSIFHTYGTPFISEFHWIGLFVTSLTAIFAFISATIFFGRGDISRVN